MAEKRRKYRFAMLDDLTLREVFHFRVSMLGAISVITISIAVLIVLLSVLIVYTPLRNFLPGYSASIRQQLIEESARVDSMQNDLTLQRRYLEAIRQLTAGELSSDSVQRLDSLQVVERTQILEERNEATDEFMAQYEQKERDLLLLFDNASMHRTVRQFYRPVRGAVMQAARPNVHEYGTVIRTAENEPVQAIARGTIVSVDRLADNTYAMVLQSGTFTAIYRHIAQPLKTPGKAVEAGESIGLMDNRYDMVFELWDEGQFVQFEEVMTW